MRRSSALLLVVALLAIPASIVFYIDPPDGCTDPWRLRLVLIPFKLFALSCDWVLEPMFGHQVHWKIGRALMEITYNLRGLPLDNPLLQVTNTTLDGVHAVLYRPKKLPLSGSPAVIYIHGGGWVFGSVVGFDRQSQMIAQGADVVVVAIEYRRAPEYPYPTPLDDCETAITHFLTHAADYGVDPNRIAISGDSAGGNLALAVSLNLRKKGVKPRLALQVLIYPVLQALDFNTPSYHTHEHHAVVRKHIMVTCWLLYAFGHARYREAFLSNQHTSPEMKQLLYTKYMKRSDLPQSHLPADYQVTQVQTGNETLWAQIKHLIANPLLSPMLEEDLADLPKTYFLSVEQDILRDEGFWFVKRLRDAGVPVDHKHYMASFHGGLVFADKFEDSRVMLDEMIDYIKHEMHDLS